MNKQIINIILFIILSILSTIYFEGVIPFEKQSLIIPIILSGFTVIGLAIGVTFEKQKQRRKLND